MPESAYAIPADYLGGHLDAIEYIGHAGTLSLGVDGAVRFTLEWFEGKSKADALMAGAKSEIITPIIVTADEMVSIGSGDPNNMRTLTRTVVGGAIGGDIGALVGAATSKRNGRLVVVYQHGEEAIAIAFGVDEGPQARFTDHVMKWRRDAGLFAGDGDDALTSPDVGALGGAASADVLVEIRDLLREIRDSLRGPDGRP